MTSETSEKPIQILIADDNPGDTRLIMEAFKEGKVSCQINSVADGVDAMAYLRREGKYVNVFPPDLILLDLNMPRKNGREVLSEIKQDPHLKIVPVIVLTTSKSERDLQEVYALHANCYLIKPIDLNSFMELVRMIETFWLTVAKLPQVQPCGDSLIEE